MNDFSFDSCGVVFHFLSDVVNYQVFREQAGSILPRMVPTDHGADIHAQILSGLPDVSYHENSFVIRGDYSVDQIVRDAAMTASHYLERELNKQGKYSMHSSALTLDNRGIILAGEGGAGKTTTALKTSINEPKFKVISGDRTVIDYELMYGGTSRIILKKGSLLTELKGLCEVEQCSDSWSQLHTFWVDDLPDSVSYDTVFLPRKAEVPLEVVEYYEDKKFLRILGNISPFSDAHPNIMLGQMRALPYFNSQELRQTRIDFAERLASRVSVIGLVGSLEDIADYISTHSN